MTTNMICEKCWADAYQQGLETELSQYRCYLILLDERHGANCESVRGECIETPLDDD